MSTPHDIPERDAWLSQALRHAPDADAAPPAALSAAILQRARATVAPPPHHVWIDRVTAAWSWLARPPVAAGFASVMVATVVGLMWWDRPLEEALPPREAPVLAAPQVAAAEASTSPRVANETANETANEAAPASPKARVAAPLKERVPAVAPALPPTLPQPRVADVAPASADTANSPSAALAVPPPDPVGESTDAAKKSAAAATTDRSERRALSSTERSTERSIERKVDLEASTLARGRLVAAAAAAPAPALDNSLAAAPARTGLAALIASLRAEPQRWSWQLGAATPQALTPALSQWLAELNTAAGARWQPTAMPPPSGSTSELRLWRDGRLHSTLRLDELVVGLDTFDPTTGALIGSQRAELSTTALTTLRASLEQATR